MVPQGAAVLKTTSTPAPTPVNTGVSAHPTPPLTGNLTGIAPDLASILAAWPKLPGAVKVGILAMIKAVQ